MLVARAIEPTGCRVCPNLQFAELHAIAWLDLVQLSTLREPDLFDIIPGALELEP